MPYIEREARAMINPEIDALIRSLRSRGSRLGELNYAITQLLLDVGLGSHPHYSSYAAVIGVLETAKLELYRKLAAPYEDKKAVENGEVYG